jgi:pSer/pThr/pTyr-binding forkhead associated (FHA) protein
MAAVLQIVEGPETGRVIEVRTPVVVGRDPDVDVHLSDDHVSRKHARLAPLPAGLEITDLGSRNGTEINGVDLPPETPATLSPGDELRLGITVLELVSEADAHESKARTAPPPLRVEARPFDYLPERAAGHAEHELDEYLDVHTKRQARTAPLAVFLVVVFAVLLYLALK